MGLEEDLFTRFLYLSCYSNQDVEFLIKFLRTEEMGDFISQVSQHVLHFGHSVFFRI